MCSQTDCFTVLESFWQKSDLQLRQKQLSKTTDFAKALFIGRKVKAD
jgi:hypothetical protein